MDPIHVKMPWIQSNFIPFHSNPSPSSNGPKKNKKKVGFQSFKSHGPWVQSSSINQKLDWNQSNLQVCAMSLDSSFHLHQFQYASSVQSNIKYLLHRGDMRGRSLGNSIANIDATWNYLVRIIVCKGLFREKNIPHALQHNRLRP